LKASRGKNLEIKVERKLMNTYYDFLNPRRPSPAEQRAEYAKYLQSQKQAAARKQQADMYLAQVNKQKQAQLAANQGREWRCERCGI
jgi:multidrug efflux pump subunit AcrA (membrane-fusion protein)